jgi:hypothetical protein
MSTSVLRFVAVARYVMANTPHPVPQSFTAGIVAKIWRTLFTGERQSKDGVDSCTCRPVVIFRKKGCC